MDTSWNTCGAGGDTEGDPSLALNWAVPICAGTRARRAHFENLGQMDQVESNLRIAKGSCNRLVAQPESTGHFRSAQIDHDRMLLARYNGHYDEALKLAGATAEWLEKFQAGKGDRAEASAILNTYLNVADQYARAEHLEEALRICQHGLDLAASINRKDYLPDFLWITSDIHRSRGELDQALSDIDEAVRLTEPGQAAELWRTMNFALGLIIKGDLLDQQNAINMGRPQEAVEILEQAFRLGDDLAHRDPVDQASRSRAANAGITLGGILAVSDPLRALAVYDHTLRHVAEIQNNSSFRRFEVSILAGSSYVLRKLGRPAEARQRLDAAFEHLRRLKLYPAERFELGSEVEESLRALAGYEAGTGNLPRAMELYQKLLDEAQPAKSSAETSLTDAVRQSTIYLETAAVQRRAGLVERASRDRTAPAICGCTGIGAPITICAPPSPVAETH